MRLTKDVLSGLMFCAFGLGAVVVSRDYNFGSLGRMGAGFFPTVVGLIIAALGAVIIAQAVLKPDSSEQVDRIGLRPVFFLSVAIVLFGILISDFGLIASLIALIVVARFAGHEGSSLEVMTMVAVLTVVAIAVFVYALNIQLNLWPS
jgi:hypothetical protein